MSAVQRWLPIAVESATTLMALCGLGYYAAALLAARSYARLVRRTRAAQDHAPVREKARAPHTSAVFADLCGFEDAGAPPVSVLKPLRGVDPGMVEALASHCRQDYPGEYELVFGIHPDDTDARDAVEQLRREFPSTNITGIECPLSLGPNGKVSTLAQMLPAARHNFFVINDSDIFVGPDYLRRVMSEFSPANVGMVTAFYSGRCVADAQGHIPVWAKLESLTVSTEFVPGAILAMQIDGGIKFALGGTLAIRRDVLKQIGGFEGLADTLADDYQMGVRTIAAGYRVAMATVTVETAVPAYSFREYFTHQLRWLRTVRDERPWGYLGLPFTFGLLWAAAAVIASAGAAWSWPLLTMALLARLALALSVGVGVLNDPQVLHRHMVLGMKGPNGEQLRVAGNPIKFSGESEPAYRYPPQLGVDNRAVLYGMLGLSDERIDQLQRDGAFGGVERAAAIGQAKR